MDDATRTMMMFDAFARSGLSSVAAGILAELLRRGGESSPLVASALARRIGVNGSAVDAALTRMARAGMITRAGKIVTLLEPGAWPTRDASTRFPAPPGIPVAPGIPAPPGILVRPGIPAPPGKFPAPPGKFPAPPGISPPHALTGPGAPAELNCVCIVSRDLIQTNKPIRAGEPGHAAPGPASPPPRALAPIPAPRIAPAPVPAPALHDRRGPDMAAEVPMAEGPDGPVPIRGSYPAGDPVEARRVADQLGMFWPDLADSAPVVANWIKVGWYPAAWVERAFQGASASGKSIGGLSYFKAILERWAQAGGPPAAVAPAWARPAEGKVVDRYPLYVDPNAIPAAGRGDAAPNPAPRPTHAAPTPRSRP